MKIISGPYLNVELFLLPAFRGAILFIIPLFFETILMPNINEKVAKNTNWDRYIFNS